MISHQHISKHINEKLLLILYFLLFDSICKYELRDGLNGLPYSGSGQFPPCPKASSSHQLAINSM